MSDGEYSRSASWMSRMSPWESSMPRRTAAPLPRLRGWERTVTCEWVAARRASSAAEPSVEPSSTSRISRRRLSSSSSSTTCATVRSSLYTGTTTLTSGRPAPLVASVTARHASHFVVRAGSVAFDEVPIVLGVEDRRLVVLARERADRVDRIPERQRREFGELAHLAREHVRALVAGRGGVRLHPGLVDVGGVGRGVRRPHGPAPSAGDHASTSSALADQPPSYARTDPSATCTIRSA